MFQDRKEAGKKLARKLAEFADSSDSVVLSIPRGGVVVGAEIAKELNLPLDAIVVKKLGVPNNPELAVGCIGQNGIKHIDFDMVFNMKIDSEYLENETRVKLKEIEERINRYGIKSDNLSGFNKFILSDDGIATGSTVRCAISMIKDISSKRDKTNIILAVPVVSRAVFDGLMKEGVRMVALEIPEDFGSVGQFYKKFPQVGDFEVLELLNKYRRM